MDNRLNMLLKYLPPFELAFKSALKETFLKVE